MWFIIPIKAPVLGPLSCRPPVGVLEVLVGRTLVDVDMVSSQKIIYIYIIYNYSIISSIIRELDYDNYPNLGGISNSNNYTDF